MREEILHELDKILPVVERVHGKQHPELYTASVLYAEWKEKADPEILMRLKMVTNDFSAPADACPTYIKAYEDLALLVKEVL